MPNRKRLLIVDDSAMDRKILANILSRRFDIARLKTATPHWN